MPDVVDVIMQDHREVERMFEVLQNDTAARAGVVPVLTTLLTAHSRAEEAEVYPVAASEAGASDEVEHSQEEHLEADRLLRRLAGTDPESPDFDTVLAEVVQSVDHHVHEEESTVLPAIRSKLSDERRAELAEAFLTARAAHLGDQPGDELKQDLEQQAANVGITGASEMTKDELARRLRERA